MAKSNLSVLTLLFLAMSAAFAHGQIPGFTWSYNITGATAAVVDHTSWCASNNCFVVVGGNISQASAGADGTFYGVDTSGHLDIFTAPSSWAEAPSGLQTCNGHAVTQISVGGVGNFVALNGQSSNNVCGYNASGPNWYSLPGNGYCSYVAIAPDGTIVCIGNRSSGYLYLYNRTSSSWNQIGTGFANFAVGNNSLIMGVTQGGGLFQWNGPGTTTWEQITPLPFTPSTSFTAITLGGQSLAMLDTGGHLYTSSAYGASGSWSTAFKGNGITAITGGTYALFALEGTLTVNHVNLMVPQITVTYAGSANCAYPSDCTGMIHTLNASVTYSGGGGTTTNQTSGPYSNQLQVVTVGVGNTCDALIDPSSELCQGTIEGSATCSVVGALEPNSSEAFSTSIIATGLATTGLKWTGTTKAGSKYQGYCGVQPYCTEATTPPMCGDQTQEEVNIPQQYDLQSVCSGIGVWQQNNQPYIEFNVLGHHFPLCASPDWGAIGLTPTTAPIDCTPQ